jgi:hypothetical protein
MTELVFCRFLAILYDPDVHFAPTARSLRGEDVMSMPNLVVHRSMTFDSAWIMLIDIKRASV